MNKQCTGTLNHLSLPTKDPIATARFLERHFACEIVTAGEHVLLKRDGVDIVLDRVAGEPQWPGNFHLGFEMATLREVEELHQAFAAAGVHMETDVFNNSRGSRFFCRTPEGVMLEINTREDKQDGWQRLF
ncbi:VOC family protein [Herbaspirillum sp. WKF16]|uniref:VOC family protein n=1 Tax=Herbaspirillum sp. WKF16 TaxID=3028312 RepID=UPI0023A974A9|nr:VOC family protein [Herbaspirillum sp. WKF16]WDZ94134.1 VOC family protein [Herbaspirillum sp. WKF16]